MYIHTFITIKMKVICLYFVEENTYKIFIKVNFFIQKHIYSRIYMVLSERIDLLFPLF